MVVEAGRAVMSGSPLLSSSLSSLSYALGLAHPLLDLLLESLELGFGIFVLVVLIFALLVPLGLVPLEAGAVRMAVPLITDQQPFGTPTCQCKPNKGKEKERKPNTLSVPSSRGHPSHRPRSFGGGGSNHVWRISSRGGRWRKPGLESGALWRRSSSDVPHCRWARAAHAHE